MKKALAVILTVLILLASVSAFAAEYRDKPTVKKVQQALNDAGYDCGEPDGIAGKKTRKAITDYRSDKGLTVSGVIDDELLASLGISAETPEEPANETKEEQEEEAAADIRSMLSMSGEVKGDFDEPALTHPEERYDHFVEGSDGSEVLIYGLLDTLNDEAADIEEYGALLATEHQLVDQQGKPGLNVDMAFQDSPYGKVMIMEYRFLWMKIRAYAISHYVFSYDGETVEINEGFEEEAMEDYFESYHFPYGSLKILHGARQDENGYTYFFIRSDDPLTFEFVVGSGMRILQLRVYEKDEDGVLRLSQYVDYDVGPAWEIPQAVLDAMDEVLGPVGK